ncbi:hypothetical protein [Sphaerospermopsis sp. LEGE 08334]|uniref:hypothetical protein n=1 Tax=Sphaerospermopsis sp. LEGE 08334 TaxID=1828651 RepID=UPI001882954C|nr:hypothetical protein [Sphaerospermopsis sp. LEGE 08334]MBE9055012.1 hypothetical protein [Sphaerospermopsis sp. LEGE 08334]
MNNQKNGINKDLAPEIFQLAAELYAQKQQEYSLDELVLIGEEAKIPAEFIQQAVELIQVKNQNKNKNKKIKILKKIPKLKVFLLGIAITTATLFISGISYKMIFVNQDNSESKIGILPGETKTKHSGNVELYLINKEGLVDGLLLKDGKQVKVPRHLSKQLINIIKPGDSVEVVGKLGTPTVYGQEIDTHTITNLETKASLSKEPKQKKEKKPEITDFQNININDSVQHWLINGKGEIRGAVLTSGTQVYFAKHLHVHLNKVAKKGSQIQAEGVGRNTPNGSVLEVISLQIDGQILPGK